MSAVLKRYPDALVSQGLNRVFDVIVVFAAPLVYAAYLTEFSNAEICRPVQTNKYSKYKKEKASKK